MFESLAKYRKLVAAAIGVALIVAASYFPGNKDVDTAIQTVIAIATLLGVYAVPNEE